MGISELIIFLVIALIVIPPEKLPELMRTAGKILRELRLASNTVVRELTETIDDPLSIRRPPAAMAPPPRIAPPEEKPAEPAPPATTT